jgi:hypothetical protein
MSDTLNQGANAVSQWIVRTVVLAVLLAASAGTALAQAPAAAPSALDQAIEQVRKDARADINALIGTSMRFSADENAKFWPLYKAYEARRKPMADERLAIIKDYAKNYAALSDEKAVELMQRSLALEDKMAAAKREFLAELQKHFPGKTVARFAQVHRRIDMLVDLTIASEVPLVQ